MRILIVQPGASISTSDVYDGLAAGLRARGHEIYEYALDARIETHGAFLTYAWRKGGKLPELKPTAADILYRAGEELVARALRVMPDVTLVVSAMYLHPDVLVLMRRAGLKVALLFTESPYDDERQERLLPFIDIGWTNERISSRGGVHYLRHAYNPDVHNLKAEYDSSVPSHDVVFVGTCFEERIELLSAVDWTGIDLALYGNWEEQLGSRSKLRKYVKGSYVPNSFAAALYRNAKIGLNLYRQSKGFGKGAPRIKEAESLNPRAYELAATGCFTISDYRAEVPEVFGDLVPTFSSPSELRLLINRWLADESGRARVRAALPNAVVDHTWHSRAAQIESDLHGVGIGASRSENNSPEAVHTRAIFKAAGMNPLPGGVH